MLQDHQVILEFPDIGQVFLSSKEDLQKSTMLRTIKLFKVTPSNTVIDISIYQLGYMQFDWFRNIRCETIFTWK